MSGIVGVYYPDNRPTDLAELGRMVDILAHRGPDEGGVWSDGSVGLGHRMLWTTPESLQEKLPLVNKTADLVLTADARIDNRDELIATLGFTDRSSGEITDSQLILAAYEKWGEDCPVRLLGDFAFAIWDGRRQKLFCARDVIGVKPFYYHHSSRAFVFASEIKAILCQPDIPRKLNEVKVADFLVPIFNDQVITYYQGILRLPPAHSLTVDGKGIRIQPYWSLDPSRELRLRSDQEYVEAFREVFTEAVRCRLRSHFPVGSTLSGGLDSSAIACMANQLLTKKGDCRLHTFSAIFPSVVEEDPRIDERPYMEAVLARGEFEPHYVRADRCKPLADVLWHEDEALGALSLYMGRAIFRAAHEQGVRVLLSGFDGDVTVSYGFEYLDELARSGRWSDFAKEAHALSQRRPRGNPMHYLYGHGFPYLTELVRSRRWWAFTKHMNKISHEFSMLRWRIFFNTAIKPLAPKFIRRIWQGWRGRPRFRSSGWGLNLAINPLFAQRIRLAERIRALQAYELTDAHPLREQHMLGLTDGRFEYVVNVFDKTAATFSLEQRYPFFDRRLVEFCLALPFHQRLQQGWTRVILRRAMDKILPPEVQWRIDKGNLSTNIRCRLLEERKDLDDVIVKDPGIIEQYVDIPALRTAYHRYLSQPVLSTEEDLFTIFLSVNLALWLRQSGLA